VLPQSAVGQQLEVRARGLELATALPTPPATLVATADIACQAPYETTEQECRHAETAALAEGLAPDAVALPGDIQYESGTMREFRGSFHPTWGQLRVPLRPVPGNHEYRTPGAADYFDYFAWQSAWRPPPWYAYSVGSWRLIALNSNCEPDRADCEAQGRWLRANLEAEPHRCTLAYWHHPRYSSGFHGSDPRTTPFWRALDRAGAEIVISGHDHHYERFAPQDAGGQRDADGVRQFVVGTGGSYPSVIRSPRAPHSESSQNRHFGVLVLRLYDDAYSWRFVALDGRTLDYGQGGCH
jgi:3',5'-cyclic AMP phosphodiesterase CpdA